MVFDSHEVEIVRVAIEEQNKAKKSGVKEIDHIRAGALIQLIKLNRWKYLPLYSFLLLETLEEDKSKIEKLLGEEVNFVYSPTYISQVLLPQLEEAVRSSRVGELKGVLMSMFVV